MKYYKLKDKIYSFDDDVTDPKYIKPEMVEITKEAALSIIDKMDVSIYCEKRDRFVVDDVLVSAKKKENQDFIWEQIKSLRQEKITEGVYLKSVNRRLHTDEQSTIEYSKISIAISLGIFEPINWKTVEGDFIELTVELFRELQSVIFEHTQRIYSKSEYHKLMMLQSNDPLTYNYSVNW